MKFLKLIVFILLIAFIGVAIYIAVQPNSYEVSRTKTIDAPPSVVYDEVIDYKKWEAWSPWIEKEPTIKLAYADKTEGEGGSYSWEGKDGIGKMKTLSANTDKSIIQEIQFDDYEPSHILWDFESTDDGKTNVTWTMTGDNLPFIFKGFAALSGGFDKMVGPDFERGLEKLDSVSMAAMKKFNIKVNGISEHGGGFYIYKTTSSRFDEMSTAIEKMMTEVSSYAMKNNLTMAGPPFTIYHSWDETLGTTMFSCCIPTTDRVIIPEGDILTGQLDPFKGVKTTLKGDYSNLSQAWDQTMAYLKQYDLKPAETGPMIESYVTDPTREPNPANWITELYVAIEQPAE